MNQKAIYNYLPGISHYCNKKETASIFRGFIRHYPEDFEFVPQSYLLPEHRVELEAAMGKKKNQTWIIKPEGGAEGCGINLT